ncbi:retrovirus-related pol polyprotein from transposon TNT 1-94 [Tanacetum coccineum]
MILESVKNGPLIWPSIEENGVTRPKKYSELCSTKAIQADCDVKATNIILQGLPPKVYALCKLYDEFDKFAYKKGETLRDFYLRFSLLLNDMNIYNMKLEQFQVNTKFLNTLPPEWSKFVTDVKLVRDLHTTNIDQLHVYLGQHEFHANETLQYGLPYQSQQYSTHQSSTPLSITYPSNDYQSFVHHNVYSPSSSITQLEYAPRVNQQPEFSQPDSDLIVLVSQKGYDPFDAINHIMTYTLGASGSNSGKQRTVICYNCKGEGHMSKQCTKPKRKQDDSWFKDKVFLVQAQANGQILHEEELAFLADSGIAEVALMANLSHYGSDALAKVHNHDNVNNNMINQAVQAMQSSEQSNVAAVQNSKSSTQQDTLILFVIEQLKTQVVNCTKINLENKSVNDTLTAKLKRYKEQVKVLKEGQNVNLKSNDNISDSSAQSVEIDRLKQTLSKHLKEKESLMQTVTLLKNDFKKEESRNIDREIALEKKIKQLDNIVFKRDQSAQTVHMLTKPQFFYDHTTKQALDPTLSCRPTKVEVPKELPKVSMVNTSLKKLKHHLAGFDVVVKERTTATAITEGSWGV